VSRRGEFRPSCLPDSRRQVNQRPSGRGSYLA
jgi:hypothetical protein